MVAAVAARLDLPPLPLTGEVAGSDTVRWMRFRCNPLPVTPANLVLAALASAMVFFAISPLARAALTIAATPVPTPVRANLSLNPAAGSANTKITVTGSSFNPNQSMNLYWDDPSHIATAVTADGNGNFTKSGVTAFPGDKPGTHRLCASVLPKPCANFALQAPASPTPTPPASTPSAEPSPSPAESPTASSLPFPLVQPNYGIDVLTKPPFVFFPIIAVLGILAALAYWALSSRRTPPNLPTASVVHRSARPDMGPIGRPLTRPTPPIQPPPPGLPPPEVPPEAQAPQEPPPEPGAPPAPRD